MYLAPINYDKYFNKVFSNEAIAKRFLEDFLETEISDFEMLKSRHRVTDDSAVVEFDYRCRINDAFVILDMQQWYKRGIVQRFYIYHALNSGLQLEQLSDKRVIYDCSYIKTDQVSNYRNLLPVITFVWMVDDRMGFDNDYISYAMAPELVTQFVKNVRLWRNPEIIELLEERNKVLKVLDNKNKDLDFLSKNRLIFLLQKNIIKNKTNAKYSKWFEFAQKTKQPDNKEEDFQEYLDDEIFCEIMRRINKNELDEADFTYIADRRKELEEVDRFEQDAYEEGRENGVKQGVKQGEKKGRAEGIKEGVKQGEKSKALKIAEKLRARGIDDEIIAEATGLSLQDLNQLYK